METSEQTAFRPSSSFTKRSEKLHNDKFVLQYALGGLLYCPALNPKAPDFITGKKKINGLRSVSLCLEDSIGDASVSEAEERLTQTFEEIYREVILENVRKSELPMLFVRVRSAEQLIRIYEKICDYELLTGFILPKFDRTNASGYIEALTEVNSGKQNIYAMPILESKDVIDLQSRFGALSEIKSAVDTISKLVLNIRVGGNDFCSRFGLRRDVTRTIYDINVVRDVLTDIYNVFGRDYVVSAPVWEYFGNDENGEWAEGLRRELSLDRLNGFIGKTAIHPSQLPIINESLSVTEEDYRDAMGILNWDSGSLGVAKSPSGGRMNEVKVHENWARKTATLASVYGVKSK